MSFNLEGKKCACCNAYLFSDDDVVFCPECGAPHHRDCYNGLGHCALENLHGTADRYDASKYEKNTEDNPDNKVSIPDNTENDNGVKVKCPNCGLEYDVKSESCPDCGMPNNFKFGKRFVAVDIDLLGGVPGDFDLGEGVKATEAKQFVLANSQRFIPKFARMKEGSKSSFNILAFFFPCAWLLSRKMYKFGAFIGVVTVSLRMLMLPFLTSMQEIIPEDLMVNYQSTALFISENMNLFNKWTLIAAFLSSALSIAIMFIVGIRGDNIYRKHVISSVKDIKENSEDIDYDMRKNGGVSLIFLIIGLVATQYLPGILASLTGL